MLFQTRLTFFHETQKENFERKVNEDCGCQAPKWHQEPWKYDKSLLKPLDRFVWETDRHLVIVHWQSWLCEFMSEVVMSSSDLFSKTADPVHKTDRHYLVLAFNLMNSLSVNNNLNLICSSKTKSTQVILTFMLFLYCFSIRFKIWKAFLCVQYKKRVRTTWRWWQHFHFGVKLFGKFH